MLHAIEGAQLYLEQHAYDIAPCDFMALLIPCSIGRSHCGASDDIANFADFQAMYLLLECNIAKSQSRYIVSDDNL